MDNVHPISSSIDGEAFRVDIARELGSIDARLKNIELTLANGSDHFAKVWEKIDENRNRINDLYIKVAVVSTIVSTLVSGVPMLMRIFAK